MIASPQVELTAKQRCCLVPVMLRMPAGAHLQRYAAPDANRGQSHNRFNLIRGRHG
jgi:hypothetical protein